MASNKGKSIFIDLSSSSSSDDDNGDENDTSSDSASCSSEIDDDDDEKNDVETEDDEEVDDDSSSDDCHGVEDDDDQSLSNRVISFLQGKCCLQELSLKACKAYLRRHGLRVSGTKNECVHRVQEHWRLKDGKAESLYPMSSFVINCTGDVCRGDIVLFKQKVYGSLIRSSFDKVTRKGKLLGRRTVVGRVVKESYGSAKQQHTFTVDVLWSKGIKKLPTLFPMLVKGRNLYRLKTYRQLWKNERERSKVLAEKHRRGTVARCNRAKRINVLSAEKGGKSRKVFHSRRSSPMTFSAGGKSYATEKRASYITTNRNNKQHHVKQGATQSNARSQSSKPFPRRESWEFQDNQISSLLSSQKYLQSPLGTCHRSRPSSSRSTEFQGEIRYNGPVMIPAASPCVSNQRSFGNSYDIQSPWVTRMDPRQLLTAKSIHGHCINGFLECSYQGCSEPGSYGCVVAACWRCCGRNRMGCNVHR